MYQKASKLMIILMIIYLFSFSKKINCEENSQNIFIGFVDDGFWRENGLVFVETKLVENEKEFYAKYRDKSKNRQYIEINEEDITKYFSSIKNDKFKLYSKDGYMGEYKIKTFCILIDGCSNNYYPYAILDKKYVLSSVDSSLAIVAIKENEIYNYEIYSEKKILKNDEIRINKILSKKLNENIKNIKNTVYPSYLESLKKNNKIKSYKLKYQIFKFDNQNNLMINAVWHFKDEKFESSTGYYLSNIFIISNNKIKDISVNISFSETLEIPEIIFGINEMKTNESHWLINIKMFEGGKIQLFKFNNIEKPIILIDGNYFGC